MAIFNAQGLSTAPVTNVLDKGLYLVEVNKAEAITSQQKGTPGLAFETTVVEGPIQQSGSMPIGRKIFFKIWISNDGQGRTIGLQKLARLCKAAGVEKTDELDLDAFLGKQLILTVDHGTYNGEPQEEVTGYKAPKV